MIMAVFADGGVVNVNPSPIAGTWACCWIDEHGWRVREASGIIWPQDTATPTVSNNQAEFFGLLQALEGLPDGWSGRVCSDSQVTLGRFFQSQRMKNISQEWVDRGGVVLRRLGELVPVLHQGHPSRAELKRGIGVKGNPVSAAQVWCDQACKREATRAMLLRVP